MAVRRKGGKERIEPEFSGRAGGRPKRELRLTPGDRIGAPKKGGSSPARRKPPTKDRRTAKKAPRRGKRFSLFGTLRRLTYWCLVLGLWAGIGLAGLLVYYGVKMPPTATWAVPERPPNVRIVSMDGAVIANRGITGGEALTLAQMSPHIPNAVMAIEDRRFYQHPGIDISGFARAMLTNLQRGRLAQGGSTLTQQLAKNLFLDPDRTIERKVQELLMAFWLEARFSKDQIMEMYLNRVYFGSGSYGVAAASRRYFDKPASEVTLSEAALLAGLLKAPSRLSPARNPDLAKARTELVLAAMGEEGMITDAQMVSAMSEPAKRAKGYWTGSEHYAADRVMEDLPRLVGEIAEDVIVDTTIDFVLQKHAETVIRSAIASEGAARGVSQGALISLDAMGAVRSLVGGRDYAESQFDRASEARRQPGSAFKPFVYMAALEMGMRPDSMVNDAPVTIGKWKPQNYDQKYRGPMTLTEALTKSINTVAAQLGASVGTDGIIEAAYRLGIRSDMAMNASIALGTSELTMTELAGAYAAFSNGGYRVEPYYIQRVTTLSGKVLYDHNTIPDRQVIAPETLGMINEMLTSVVENGTGQRAALPGWQVAGKTGTTQNFRDAWFVGYTSNLVTAVWFGNDDGKPTKKMTGGQLPADTWRLFMEAAHAGIPTAALPGVQYVPVSSTAPGNPDAVPDLAAGQTTVDQIIALPSPPTARFSASRFLDRLLQR